MVGLPSRSQKSTANTAETTKVYTNGQRASKTESRTKRIKKETDTAHVSESLLRMAKRQRHRVIVQLKDIDADEEVRQMLLLSPNMARLNSTALGLTLPKRGRPTAPAYYMEVMDEHTLLLNKRLGPTVGRRQHGCQQLQFDCVGGIKDVQLRAEYSDLMDQLLFQHNNCCLMRFTVVRECSLVFLCDLLVREVDKRMHQMRGYMHSIRLEYYDVQKFNVVSLFERAVKLGAPRSKRVLTPRPRNHFNNTLELLKWLQEQYTQLWTIGRGHDMLELHMKFTDVRRRVYNVKLALVQICANKMDAETKAGLRNFLENIDGSKRLRPNIMTDCLREYFNGKDLWHTWMVFDVPRYYVSNLCIDDMLQMANAAYAGVRSMESSGESNASLTLERLISSSSIAPSNRSSIKLRVRSKSLSARKRMGITSSSLSLADSNDTNHSLKVISCPRDADNLSYWYWRMDEQIGNVMNTMENYYEHKYDTEISKISSDIKQMTSTNKEQSSEAIATSASAAAATATTTLTAKKLESTSQQELQKLHGQYTLAVHRFQQLVKEIERSKFSDLLEIYLKTKNSELAQHALRFKVQQLEFCQSKVSDIITREMSAMQQQNRHSTQSINATLSASKNNMEHQRSTTEQSTNTWES